jgi:hypothetical protein
MKTTVCDRSWLAAALLLLASPAPHAQGSKMYKCLIDGRTVYQQTACPANAIDAKPGAASAGASAAASAPRAPTPASGASSPGR